MTDLAPMISDILLFAATLGAGTYCLILSRRLTRLSSIDKGLGGAIAVLSAQVDDMTKALAEARTGSEKTVARLSGLMKDAEALANDLEVMIAACHDLTPVEDAEAAMRTALHEDAADAAEPMPERPAGSPVPFGTRRSRGGDDEAAPVFRRSSATAEAAQ